MYGMQFEQFKYVLKNDRMPTFSGKRAWKAQRKLLEAYGYDCAKHLFFKGKITRAQAIGMVKLDTMFKSEAEITEKFGFSAHNAAWHVVENVWLPELVKG
jgi:hypothetical protein